MAIHITGGCLCGDVRYEASQLPVRGVICHCSMCRKHSGAPALGFAIFHVPSFTWTSVGPSWYASSSHAERGFCPRCGSSIATREYDEPSIIEIYAGSLDNPDELVINDHIWVSEQISWLITSDGLPRYPTDNPRAG